MAHHITNTQADTDILKQIREGMTVYDSEKNDIGTVEAVYFGAASDEEITGTVPATTSDQPGDVVENRLVGTFAHLFDDNDDIPEELAERLRYSGYIKVEGGWFGADRYIMPNQITSVSGEDVYLNTRSKRLIKE